MGTIQAGTGIISGLPTDSIITQLLAIEGRPLQLVQNRIGRIKSQQTAFLDISARLLAVKNAVSQFDSPDFFRAATATSSNENVLLATAEPGALPASYTFQVHSLVQTHQLISSGFADRDATPVGGGRITIERGNGKLNESTALDLLNGQKGVRRGAIRVTDRAGGTADIDLTAALTINDVLDAINTQSSARVQATVDGDRLKLTDVSGGPGNLTVVDLALGHTAADLGIAASVAGHSITGTDLVQLADSTVLDLLNDGNGVRRQQKLDDLTITARDGSLFNVALNDDLNVDGSTRLEALNNGNGVRLGTIRITPRSGDAVEIDLSSAQTVADVLGAINDAFPNDPASGPKVTAAVASNASHLLLTLTGVATPGEGDPAIPNFTVEDVTGFAARDLGIAADAESNTIVGSDVYRVNTIGDVLRAINFAVDASGVSNGGRVVASLATNGNGIVLTDSTAGGAGSALIVASANGSAAEDLGIAGSAESGVIQSRDLLAGLNTVLVGTLNGGAGATLGNLDVTLRDGSTASIDLAGAQTVAEILDGINASGLAISASVNAVGNGIVVRDLSGGSGNLVITDGAGGTAASDLNILVNVAADEVQSGNLQRQYISETTKLDKLNAGAGIQRGRFRITDSAGKTAVIDLTGGNEVTVGDVLREINSKNTDPDNPSQSLLSVEARVNDTGDGIVLVDTAGGGGKLRVSEEGSTTAADLNLLGEAPEGATRIDGSYEVTIDLSAGDTLNDLAAKLNATGTGVSAAILNDGSGFDAFRLAVTSDTAGKQGRVLIDAGSTGIAFNTLIQPRDALVFLGGDDSSNAVLLSSGTNSLDGVIRGVTLDLVGTSDKPVNITIGRDVQGVIDGMGQFTQTFNDALDRIDELTKFDAETKERGVLQGEGGARRIQDRLLRGVTRAVDTSSPTINRLASVGIQLHNGRLRFDATKFQQVLTADPAAVTDLFANAGNAFGVAFNDVLDGLTSTTDGLITQQTNRLTSREDLLNNRAADLQDLLDAKEARLRANFLAMERALAGLQSQQTALDSLGGLSAGAGLGLGT